MNVRTIAAAFMCAAATPAAALTFNFTTVQGDTLTAGQAAGFNTAAANWSSILSDNITVNLQIGFRALGSSILGQTSPNYLGGSASYIDGLLAADAKDSNDAMAVASLVTQTATTLSVTSAEAKALGAVVTPGRTDGTIEFSTSYSFSNARNPDGSIAAGTYDLVGVAEHEIAHVLGFDSSIDGGSGNQTVLDQFRFSAAAVRSVTAGAPAYFSLDNGVTNINSFSVGGAGNYQASHWIQGTGALLDPANAPGQAINITALDIKALDVIGYDVAIPEPGSITILLAGLGGIAYTRRRAHA